MRKRISGLMTLVCLLVAAASALAAGTTVTTFTPFADMDFAAQGYMDLITAWEDETGNMVEDYSGLEDDLFMEQMQEMVTAGRADLVVVPLGSGLTKDQRTDPVPYQCQCSCLYLFQAWFFCGRH